MAFHKLSVRLQLPVPADRRSFMQRPPGTGTKLAPGSEGIPPGLPQAKARYLERISSCQEPSWAQASSAHRDMPAWRVTSVISQPRHRFGSSSMEGVAMAACQVATRTAKDHVLGPALGPVETCGLACLAFLAHRCFEPPCTCRLCRCSTCQ